MIMSNKNYAKKLCSILVATIIFATSCSSTAMENRPNDSMSLKLLGTESIIEHGGIENPWINISFANKLVFRNLLVSVDTDMDGVLPDLAESYTRSEDGLTYTFTLKDYPCWSDDEPVVIEDVVFSIQALLLADEANELFITAFADIEGADEFINGNSDTISGLSVDGHTLTIKLLNPRTSFLQIIAQFAILPEHILKDEDLSSLSTSSFWNDPVTCGMYKVGEHIQGESQEYIYNEKYTGTAPYINSLILRSDYTADEVDYYDTNDVAKILEYRSTANKTEHKIDSLYYRYLVFNIVKDGEIDSVMGDVRVRQAIVNAIDREELLGSVYYNTGSVVKTTVWGDTGKRDFSYNPELAKELLAEANYDFDRPLTLLYYYTDDTSKKFMDRLSDYLEYVGFTVEIIEQGDLYSEEHDHYDVGIKGLPAFSISEWYMEYHSYHKMHRELFGGEPMFDDVLNEYAATTNQEDREVVINKMRDLGEELIYKVPLYTIDYMAYVNENRVNLADDTTFGNPRYRYYLDIENWKIVG